MRSGQRDLDGPGPPRAAGRARPAAAALLVLLVSTAAVASAPSRLVTPTYYLTTAPELVEGEPLQGSLSDHDGQNFKDGSRVDVVKTRGSAGEPVVIEALSDTIDTHLTLYGPEGDLVAVNDDGPASLDARIGIEFPDDGTYVVVISGFDREDLGAYRLVRRRPEASKVEPLPFPGEFHTTLEADMLPTEDLGSGPSRAFSLELDEALLVMITAMSEDVDTVLAAVDAEGERVGRNDDSDLGTDSRLWLELEPGRYRIVVAAYGEGAAGDVRLRTRGYRPLD